MIQLADSVKHFDVEFRIDCNEVFHTIKNDFDNFWICTHPKITFGADIISNRFDYVSPNAAGWISPACLISYE